MSYDEEAYFLAYRYRDRPVHNWNSKETGGKYTYHSIFNSLLFIFYILVHCNYFIVYGSSGICPIVASILMQIKGFFCKTNKPKQAISSLKKSLVLVNRYFCINVDRHFLESILKGIICI